MDRDVTICLIKQEVEKKSRFKSKVKSVKSFLKRYKVKKKASKSSEE